MRVPVPAGRGPGHWQLPSARQDAERARRARPGTHGGCASWHARRVRVLARTAGARPGTHGGCASWHARQVRVLARTELTRVSCTPSFLGRKACVPNRHDPNIKAKAIRLVREHRGDYPSEFAAIKVVAGRLGMTPETLRKWIRQAEVDEGTAPGTSTAESAQVRELKRKNRELEQTIEILKAATGFFAREYDPRQS